MLKIVVDVFLKLMKNGKEGEKTKTLDANGVISRIKTQD